MKRLLMLLSVAATLSCETENQLKHVNKTELQEILDNNQDFKSLVHAQLQNTLALVNLTKEQDEALTNRLQELSGNPTSAASEKLFNAFNLDKNIIESASRVKNYLDSRFIYKTEDLNTCVSEGVTKKLKEIIQSGKDDPGYPAIVVILVSKCFLDCAVLAANHLQSLIDQGQDQSAASTAAESQYLACLKECKAVSDQK